MCQNLGRLGFGLCELFYLGVSFLLGLRSCAGLDLEFFPHFTQRLDAGLCLVLSVSPGLCLCSGLFLGRTDRLIEGPNLFPDLGQFLFVGFRSGLQLSPHLLLESVSRLRFCLGPLFGFHFGLGFGLRSGLGLCGFPGLCLKFLLGFDTQPGLFFERLQRFDLFPRFNSQSCFGFGYCVGVGLSLGLCLGSGVGLCPSLSRRSGFGLGPEPCLGPCYCLGINCPPRCSIEFGFCLDSGLCLGLLLSLVSCLDLVLVKAGR